MTTRRYKVFAQDERREYINAVAKDGKTRHRGEYRARTAWVVKMWAKRVLHLWEVTLT
mgnify:CR=1 FL=1